MSERADKNPSVACRQQAENWQRTNLTRDECARLKLIACNGASYAPRMSTLFVLKLLALRQDALSATDLSILTEVESLEAGKATSTKPASKFLRPPLTPLWHKHFFRSRSMLPNVGERWGLQNGKGNSELDTMIDDCIRDHSNDLELLHKAVAYKFLVGALMERASAGRLTGDWIIFAKFGGRNIYLDIASHDEGYSQNVDAVADRLRKTAEYDFPFLCGPNWGTGAGQTELP